MAKGPSRPAIAMLENKRFNWHFSFLKKFAQILEKAVAACFGFLERISGMLGKELAFAVTSLRLGGICTLVCTSKEKCRMMLSVAETRTVVGSDALGGRGRSTRCSCLRKVVVLDTIIRFGGDGVPNSSRHSVYCSIGVCSGTENHSEGRKKPPVYVGTCLIVTRYGGQKDVRDS